MKKFFLILCGLLVAAVLTIVLVNGKDEPLNPAIPPLLSWQVTLVDHNGYPFLLGFSAPSDQDPLVLGEKRIEAFRSGKKDPLYEQAANPVVKDPDALLCRMTEEGCYQQYQTETAAIEQLAVDNLSWLERYEKLIQFPHYQEILEPRLTTPLISYGGLSKTHQLFLAGIALDPVDRAGQLRQDIRFWRMVLAQPSGLISKMVAANSAKSAYALLHLILQDHPQLHSAFLQELQPLSDDERSLVHCLNQEFAIMAKLFLDLKYDEDAISGSGFDRILNSRIGMYFYQRQATVNRYYRYHLKLLNAVKESQAAMQELGRKETADLLDTWKMAYNPVGRTLLSIAIPQISSSLRQIEELDDQIKATAPANTGAQGD